ncbi:hypothetical protein EEL30_21415 [Brevibacillus laterosporus]|uniref:Uncharacterized protein n=1 Tax=Brevibacillus laterosporus TaxID=1465 RepID=A0A518VC98_BRELA|nr:hypothetical protein EEL30_21415 [Brevibacillus laterosporus]
MKIEVGMKCKQVVVIEEFDFDYVDQEFEITKVTDTVIMGKRLESGVGFGIEPNKFEEYFELLHEIKTENTYIKDNIKVIQNDRVTIVILPDGSKGVSKCLPQDTYDATKGYDIAYIKAKIKSLKKQLKQLSK